jgi:CPA1 family monovalent cation:H+ antiporter
MTSIQLAAVVVSLTALLAYVNARFVKLPRQIGLLAIALAGSLIVVGLDAIGVIDAARIQHLVGRADFARVLLHGMLGLLLFAGALHLDVHALAAQRWPIAALSLGGTAVSTVLVGGAIFILTAVIGHPLALIDAMLFGALISPTDPIAVLGVLKTSRVPDTLAVQVSGESLFNDGVGVVIFTVLLELRGGTAVSAGGVATLFARETLGGAAFGFALGYLGYRMLRTIDDYIVEVLVTLGIVLGGYAAAETMGISGPIGAVVSGLVIGHRPHAAADHADVTHAQVGLFWELIDETLNAVLFLMLGLEATRLHLTSAVAIAAIAAVPIVLAARVASVAASVSVLRPFGPRAPAHAVKILTWGGLRGGLAVALALSLPDGPSRDAIIVMTYAVVAASILGQGLTLPRLLRRLGL